MMIHRIKRVPQGQEAEMCDFCDETISTGFEFSGDDVHGPRSGTFLRVCDECLKKAKSSPTAYYRPGKAD